jgi:hypothetical protein
MAAAQAGGVLALLMRPLHKYNSVLERHPLVTKSVTSGVMYAAGDVLAQRIEQQQAAAAAGSAGHDAGRGSTAAGAGTVTVPAGAHAAFKVDWYRTAVFFAFGTFIAGESG